LKVLYAIARNKAGNLLFRKAVGRIFMEIKPLACRNSPWERRVPQVR
jgi:hypothetical protein